MKRLSLIAAGGSLALMLAAYGFQHFGGLAPCKMCLWQRWPHAAAIVLGGLMLIFPARVVAWLGALAAATTSAIGFYHSGVEQKWWEGPSSCTGGGLSGLSGNALLDPNAAGKVVMCDDIAWAFLGLSMPTWNGIVSLALALIWVAAARR
jgi:disulfide bond formation protein DsbB